MYKLILKQTLQDKAFYIKITLGLVILSYVCGKNLSILENENINIVEFIILTLFDKYYFTYGIMSVFLFILISNIGLNNEFYFIRKVKFINYFIHRNIANLVISICFIFVQIVTSFMIGITRFKIFTENINLSMIELIVLTFYTILGMFFITVIIEFVNYFVSKNITIIFILLAYLSIWLGIRGLCNDNFYFLYLNNYLLFEYGIENLMSLLIIEIAIVLLIFYFINKKWWIKN